jgi:hypothetical protein
LRSAAACDHDTDHWVKQLRRVGTEWLAAVDKDGLERAESPLPRAGPLQGANGLAARALGVDNEPPAESLQGVGRLAASAIVSEDKLAAQTAALSLLALKPDRAVGDIQEALKRIERGSLRRRRRAMLFGALADAGSDSEEKVRSELEHPQDLAGVWWWRARRHIRRDGALIMSWSFWGAFGAALALAVYRAFLAIFNARFMGTEFAIQSYWGFIIGFLMSLGMALAGPLLLHDMQTGDAGQRRGTDRLALMLGAAGFSLANGLVMWMNGLGLTINTFLLFLFTSFLAGLILGIGLYGQPQAGWTAGLGTWLKRLLLPAILMAALQSPVLFEAMAGSDGNYLLDNAQWLAASVFEPAEALVNKYGFYPTLDAIFNQCIPVETGGSCLACTGSGLLYACFEQWWSMADAAVTSMLLLLGMMTGWHFPQTWLGRLWDRFLRWLTGLV